MDWSADERLDASGAHAPEGVGAAARTSVDGAGSAGWSGVAGWAGAFRIELRVQAIELAARGWPIMPGTYPIGNGEWTGGSNGPVPARSDWQQQPRIGVQEAASFWGDQPYSVLVATGDSVEALETGSELGRRTARALRSIGVPVPIVATPDARWYFLVAGGNDAAVCPDLVAAGAVRRHTSGSWLPVPPSTFHHGVVHWRVKPDVCGWQLPSPELVGAALRLGADTAEDVANLVVAGN